MIYLGDSSTYSYVQIAYAPHFPHLWESLPNEPTRHSGQRGRYRLVPYLQICLCAGGLQTLEGSRESLGGDPRCIAGYHDHGWKIHEHLPSWLLHRSSLRLLSFSFKMPLQYSPEFLKALAPLLPALTSRAKPAIHDIQSRRNNHGFVEKLLDAFPTATEVEETVHHAEAADGYQIAVHAFTRKEKSHTPTAAVLHCHGGGMIMGSVAAFSKGIANQVARTGLPFFSVDYRLAPEHTGTGPVDDCYQGLLWVMEHSTQFGVDSSRIAVMGESAGGGIAAGVVLQARDKGLRPPLAKQVLVYPMLDDRNNKPIEALEPLAFWKVSDNITGWTALLGQDKAGIPEADVSEYAAPARAKNLSGLPSAYIDVGGLDIFRDEDIEFARRLAAENVEIEFHLFPGVPHGFDLLAPDAPVSIRANEHRYRALSTI